jgi:hypothetical protein
MYEDYIAVQSFDLKANFLTRENIFRIMALTPDILFVEN